MRRTDYTLYDQLRLERRRLWAWRGLAAAGIIGIGVHFCNQYVAEGERVRDAMPPRVVTERTHTVTSSAHSCGKDCVSSSNTDHWTLVAEDGGVCEVERVQWAATRPGMRVKCPQLYGWSD